MAPSAISPPASPTLLVSSPAPLRDTLSPTTKYTDWRKDLQQNGYAVVKNAIPYDRALGYRQKAFEWLKSFGNDKLDFEDPETWIKENLPKQSKINTFSSYGVAHEKFMWDARMEPGVIDAFVKLWGTDKLLVSFDSLNVTFPNRKDIPRKEPWEHIDQSPLRRGIHCIQGIINLSKSGPEDGGLLVYPGSHLLNDDFFDTQTDKSTWDKKDVYLYSKEQLKWFTDKHNIQPQKVCADIGDLILWDSRTIHYGAEPTVNSNTIRTIIYAAFAPADLASPEMLKLKAEAFEKRSGTSHWPHDNILVRSTETYLDDGTRDPRDRDQPLQLPELSDKLLKLAGVKAY